MDIFTSSREIGLQQKSGSLEPFASDQLTATSIFAARMFVWITGVDASAASYGLGGKLSSSLNDIMSHMGDNNEGRRVCCWLYGLHHYSKSLFRQVWGPAYPQAELLDDYENQEVFDLLGDCFQLRYKAAELASSYGKDTAAAKENTIQLERALRAIGAKYASLLELASALTLDESDTRRLISNICFIVPQYHAVVLSLLRITRFHEKLGNRQRQAMREILNLAFQGFKRGGLIGVLRITWPLFMVGLETDDLVHREWILTRFRELRRFGKNYARAYRFLERALEEQARLGHRVDIIAFLESGDFERFVI